MLVLQIFVGISVFAFLCLVLLASAFLAGSLGNVLILRVALRGAKDCE